MADRRKSKMWDHFTSKSSKVVHCNICNEDLAFAGGTGCMKNHLKAKHPLVLSTAAETPGTVFTQFFLLHVVYYLAKFQH